MKRKSILLLFLLGLMSMQVSAKWFQQKTLFSKALQQEKAYYISLPKGYNEADTITKYPVIVFLHGASTTATEMASTLELLFFFIKTDNLSKVIFIIPDGSCEPYKGSFYTNSALYGNYEDYIIQDMMEEIESKYHTYNHREKWSIMGHSMGGYGAMKMALKYPEKFIGVSALSGPVNITHYDEILPILYSEHGSAPPYDFTYSGSVTKLLYSMAGAFSPNPGANPPILFPINSGGATEPLVTDIWEKHNPINLIKEWKGSPAMAIHTYCGELDEFKLAIANKMFSDTLDKYILPHTYKQDPSGDHVNSLFTSLPQGINFLYQVMDTVQIQTGTLVDQITSANEWLVYPNPVYDRFFVSGATDKIRHMAVHNITGQKVMQIENPVLNQGIDISKLGKGVYFLSLQNTKGKTSTMRVVKN